MKVCLDCGFRFDSMSWECPSCGFRTNNKGGILSFIDPGQELHGFDPGHYSKLYEIEEGHFWFVHRTGIILEKIRTSGPGAHKLLELGCGTGIVLAAVHKTFPVIDLHGCDLYAEGPRFAANRVPGASFYQLDACRMPFEDEFDIILALDVLEHIEDDEKAISEMYRSLRKGGRLIVTVPQHR
jgi:SAM-dependent methyltransferase